jgi:hypothetical protein
MTLTKPLFTFISQNIGADSFHQSFSKHLLFVRNDTRCWEYKKIKDTVLSITDVQWGTQTVQANSEKEEQ